MLVYDPLSMTQASQKCLMYAASEGVSILDMQISTEANKNGYIDFNAEMAAFKVQLGNLTAVNANNLTFKWQLSDNAGTVFTPKQMSIYKNSMGIKTSQLTRGNIYNVQVNVTDGKMQGYINTYYQTEPSLSF